MGYRENPVVLMSWCRIIGAGIEIIAVILMLKINTIQAALRINAILGLLGTIVLVGVSGLGLCSLIGRISPIKIIMVLCGAVLIILGTR
ncbi:MAG: DUF2619 domain-containing protein [Firmicutes bacterium]|nr:DUF2619 domain-containing protein [Bacillota bacterium]